MDDTRTLEARARKEGTPLIDGDTATFVWKGPRQVFLQGDFQDWHGKPLPLERVGKGLWARSLALPEDAYVEYALQDAKGRRVRDVLNPRRSDNGFGDFNHCFWMPKGQPTPLGKRGRDVPKGRVTRHQLETHEWAVGRKRAVSLYAPPVKGPVPLMVVLDGDDYLKRVQLPTLVDNLIAAGRMRPVAMAFVANGGPARTVEYGCNEATVGFLEQRVLPLAREHLSLVDEGRTPGAHAVLGSSLGGLMALYAAQRLPRVFGRVLSQSGAFAIEGSDMVVFDLARRTGQPPLHVWMDCGRFEGLQDGNERLLPTLHATGHRVTYRPYSGGHNYPAWQTSLPAGLEEIFSPAG
ncbi:alpha/beta hydrolase-fold protein [Corallococcus aberystwythensis]|uniref:Esterase family protein n=1 Tax=Corallococcus aberystwythensis TaxID=2316722 RepID=A0A3A8P875_9BACT|nr:alpha/beta hydrolase-fold protein [Corallococcus aberystwythensis]RKH52069.1 esterase family protein [Corallococcus aberystwythensis]